LSKAFAGVRALDSVDIQIGHGDIHALLGANGSGKSTLVKVLTGVYQPDRGTISVGSRSLPAIVSPHQAGQLGIAVVHQEAPLIDTMTIAECIALFRGYPARGGRVLWGRLHAETVEMLARFGVRVDPRMLAGKLSPAERALVALVIALDQVKTGLELLILDEVTASLQEDQARSFLERVSAIAAAGTPVLMVTHRLAELHGRATQVTVLRDGRVVHAAPAGAADDHALIGLMIGRKVTPQSGMAAPAATGSVRRLWGEATTTDGTAPALGEVVLDVAHLASRFMTDVTFSVRRGEIVGVAGLVENGIAELPQILGGLQPRRAGSVTIAGHALAVRSSPREAIDAGLALLPVDRLRSGGVATLPVTDNALLPQLGRYWHAGRRERDVLARLIEGLDVRPPVPGTLFGRLSGGNQQKVLLGKWLLLRPSVLVLEDPTSGVDPNARAKIFEVLRDAAREGVGILFLSTEPEQLADMCGRVLILRDGVVATELSGGELDQEAISRWCYA